MDFQHHSTINLISLATTWMLRLFPSRRYLCFSEIFSGKPASLIKTKYTLLFKYLYSCFASHLQLSHCLVLIQIMTAGTVQGAYQKLTT